MTERLPLVYNPASGGFMNLPAADTIKIPASNPQSVSGAQTLDASKANASLVSSDNTQVTYTVTGPFVIGDLIILTQGGTGQIILSAGSGINLNFPLPTHTGTAAQNVPIGLYVLSVGGGTTTIGVCGFTGPTV